MREHALLFGEHRTLVGIVTDPPQPSAASVGAIFLNAGVIHRVGPSRLYVRLARALAGAGAVALRFDHSGIGDTPARRDGQSFEASAIAEAREAMDALQQARGIRRFVLIGLCSGAVTSFDAAGVDERVAGVIMINPQGFDENAAWNSYVQNRGHARKYWRQSLFSPASWARALTGRIDYRRLAGVLWRQLTAGVRSEQVVLPVVIRVASDLQRLIHRGVRTLLVCSEGDEGIDYMNVILEEDVRNLPPTPQFTVAILPGADHSLTLRESQRRMTDVVETWARALLSQIAAGEAAVPGGQSRIEPLPAVALRGAQTSA